MEDFAAAAGKLTSAVASFTPGGRALPLQQFHLLPCVDLHLRLHHLHHEELHDAQAVVRLELLDFLDVLDLDDIVGRLANQCLKSGDLLLLLQHHLTLFSDS